MRIAIATLGCKVNQAESSLIAGALKSVGYNIVDLSEGPDICIINTCTVTSKSDYRSRQLIRRAQRAGARVFVTGCYSELNRDSVRTMKGVEEIIENSNKLNIISNIIGKDTDALLARTTESVHEPNKTFKKRSRLFIKIQDGCNYSCSYCVIPRARGASKSETPEIVVQKVEEAVSLGYNEIVLTGIHLGTYGCDLKPKVKLSKLLTTILKKTKIKRIRLSSLEVRELDDELLELLGDKRICNHLHIPLQSGDDRILKLMNRLYDSSEFFLKIKHIYKKFPEIAIGTDVIVGFPGEGDPEFQNTYKLLENLPVAYMHIFPFSARPGTIASEMYDNTPYSIKKERAHILKERAHILESLNTRKKTEYMLKQIGKTLDVLVEDISNNGTCSGTTRNYLRILLPSNNYPRGCLISVRIAGLKEGTLSGIPIL